MEHSILDDIKTLLNVADGDTSFDDELILHINAVFLVLNQIGVGPESIYAIHSSLETWNDFFDDTDKLEAVKMYMSMKVKMAWDPPMSSTIMEVMKNTISEYEFRLGLQVDPKKES